MALKKIEGQVGGLQRMINDERYCVDILMQIHAVVAGLRKVQKNILHDHLDGCVRTAFGSNSDKERQQKLDEIFKILDGYRK